MIKLSDSSRMSIAFNFLFTFSINVFNYCLYGCFFTIKETKDRQAIVSSSIPPYIEEKTNLVNCVLCRPPFTLRADHLLAL